MVLFGEYTQKCAQKVVDPADIVRDRDVTPIMESKLMEQDKCEHPSLILSRG